MATADDLAVRFVTGRELASVEADAVLDPADLWRTGGERHVE
ncbi:hypothetical protein [Halorussus marinus]|nr:hypothetical protein [Halorussus marinus]